MPAVNSGPPRAKPSLGGPLRLAVTVFVVGVGLAALAAVWQAKHNVRLADRSFDELVARTVEQVRLRLRIYEYGLRAVRGAVVSTGIDQIDRRRFRGYSDSRDIEREFPGARGMGMIRRVREPDEPRFLLASRRQVAPDFEIRMLSPHAGDRYVIQYIEPLERNLPSIGLDIASDPSRRAAAERAMRSGQATLTAPITLVQATGKPLRSFLLLLPIYGSGDLSTPEARATATVAWAFAPLITDDVLAGFSLDRDLSLSLRDESELQAGVFFATPGYSRPAARGLSRRSSIPIYGRTWVAELRATPAFVAGLNLLDPFALGAAGLSLAALLAMLSLIYAQGRHREGQVSAEQARRAAIVDSTRDAVIGETLDGIVTDWNHGAELMFGHSAAKALGQPAASLILPPERATEDAEIRDAVARGETILPFDTTRCRADGALIDVSVMAAPIWGDARRLVGFSKTIRDISAAKRAAREIAELNANLERDVQERTALLHASQRDLRNILDAVPSLVSYWDRDVRNRFANRAYQEWLGWDPLQMPGKHMRELFSAGFDSALPRVQAALRGEPTIFETSLPTREGGVRHAVAHYLPDVVGGVVQGFYVIVYDVTEQTEARVELAAAVRKLQHTKDRNALATDGAGIGVWEWDIEANTLTWDDWMYRLYGQPATSSEQPYKLWVESLHPDDRARAEREIQAAVRGEELFDTEFRIFRPDGEMRHIKASARVMSGAGKPVRMTGVNTDITERKRAELELIETSSLLQSLLESASEVAIIAGNRSMVINVFNRGAERLLGYSAEEIVNRATPALFHDPEEVAARAQELTTLSGEPVIGGNAFIHPLALRQPHEWTYIRKDGTRITVSLVVTAMYGKDGAVFGYVGVAHDVTRQKQYESSLHDSMRGAEQASRAKSQFLANMSHEIRTPMNAVVGLSYLLGQTALDSEQASFVSKIHVASHSLLALLNDVLDVSKIEAGELSLERAPFDLSTLLAEVSDLAAIQAHAKHIGFHADLPDSLPQAVEGDVTRLAQVLNNLLSNAVKFTSLGGVTLRVREVSRAEAAVELRFEVEDTGIGIATDVQGRLFVPFAQADASTTRRFGGTGLGLSIVKRLAGLMGGEVGLESEPDVGSIFSVTLSLGLAHPALLSKKSDASQRTMNGLNGVRVLVADDSEINLFVAKRILEQEGATVTVAGNGQEAVDYLRRRASSFDVVLMDVHMPVMDGYGASFVIRRELGLSLPIIALTADARTSERQRALAAGMNEFLSKPFEPRALIGCIQKLVATTSFRPVSRSSPGEATTSDPSWPLLPGIDVAEVRERLYSDRTLFRALLFRLLDEFSDVTPPKDLSDGDAVAAYAAKMHKLRGASGQLAARAIHELAGRIEQGFTGGKAKSAVVLVKGLALHMERLRAVADTAFAPGPLLESPSSVPTEPDEREFSEVLELLRQQNLAVLERVRGIYPWARQAWAIEQFERFAQHIQDLRFADAAVILEAHISPAPHAVPA